MKKVLSIFLMGIAVIFFISCSDNSLVSPETQEGDQVEVLKKGVSRIAFTGTCSPLPDGIIDGGIAEVLPNGKTLVKGQIAKWIDEGSDPRITGFSYWYASWVMESVPNTARLWGKAEIFVDNAQYEGKWELTWHGWQTPTADGFKIVCYAAGQGKEGDVKGMVGEWTYTMNFSVSDPVGSFMYLTEGYIQ